MSHAPRQEETLATEAVAKRPSGQEQDGEGQRVSVHHPLQVQEARMQA